MAMTARAPGRYIKSGGSIGTARIVAQAAQFCGFVFAARFLTVAEFGLYALVLVLIMFLMLFAGFGWAQLAATSDDERGEALGLARRAGALLAAGLVIFSFLAFEAGLIPSAALQLCLCLAPLLYLRANTNVWSACMTVDGKATKVAMLEATSEISALAALIFSLNAGLGLLSLGIAKFVQELVAYFLARQHTDFRTAEPLVIGRVPRQLRFALSVIGGRVINFANENMSTVIIGAFLGPIGTGLYRAGARFSSSGREVIAEMMRTASWIRLRGVGEDGWSHATKELVFWSLAIGFLLLAGLAVVADLVVELLLGEQWAPAAPVASLLAIRAVFLLPQTTLETLMSYSDNVRLAPWLAAISAVASIVALLVMAPYGLYWAAASQLIVALVTVATTTWAFHYILKERAASFIAIFVKPMIAGGIMVAAVLAFRGVHADATVGQQIAELLLSIVIGAIVYVIVLGIIHPPIRDLVAAKLRRGQD